MADVIDRHEETIVVAAPPDVVWSVVVDVPRTGEWSPVCHSCRWLVEPGRPVAGARFVGHNRRGAFRWSRECVVTAAEPGRRFAFHTLFRGQPSTSWEYELQPANGGTRLTQRYEAMLLPRWVRALRTLPGITARTRRDAAANIRVSLANLKRVAEAGTTSGS